MSVVLLSILIGLVAGVFSGLLGIGGGLILIPALILIFKMSQQTAQGTTLALMVLPIGLLAAITYYKSGNVNLVVGLLIALGFFFGGLLGANIAVSLSNDILRKIFAAALILAGLYMIITK
ncbi:MAG: TSUP family transporter [Elusimicrobia bacterium]|nr:TSUP family transporter [Elusimicrobiota bacterium]